MIKNHNIFLSKNTIISDKIPVAVKDNICVDGYKATCGSLALKDFFPGYNAAAVDKLLQKEFYVAGKTNMDEFAMGSTGLNSAFGIVENPKHKEYITGGSSSGSAAVVASGEINLALGSDTGGSVRVPASFCEIYGFKPTYGAISRYGLISFASSLDVIGIFGQKINIIEKLFEAISGKDSKDSTSIEIKNKLKNKKKPKIAFLETYDINLSESIDKRYSEIFLKISKEFHTERITMKYFDYWLSVYFIISSCEAVSNLSRYDNKLFGNFKKSLDNYHQDYPVYRNKLLGKEVKRRILTGNFALLNKNYSRYYKKSSIIRKMIKTEFDNIFKEFDFIITPTTPTHPYKISDSDIIKNYRSDLFTCGVSLAGNPAISIPSNTKTDNFYPGIQIIGNYGHDFSLLNFSKEIENIL